MDNIEWPRLVGFASNCSRPFTAEKCDNEFMMGHKRVCQCNTPSLR